MATRKPGPGSSQAEISAYIRQEIAKKMEKMSSKSKMGAEGPKRSAAKKSTPSAKGGRGKGKPAPKLY
jgi:hypothetical protein